MVYSGRMPRASCPTFLPSPPCPPPPPPGPPMIYQDEGVLCVWAQEVEGGNRAAGGSMGAGISLPDRPPGPPVEGRSGLAAPLWPPLCACRHVSPCPPGCALHPCIFSLPFPFLLPSNCLVLCRCPSFAFCPCSAVQVVHLLSRNAQLHNMTARTGTGIRTSSSSS